VQHFGDLCGLVVGLKRIQGFVQVEKSVGVPGQFDPLPAAAPLFSWGPLQGTGVSCKI
jgi:hypothetical protein